MIQLFKILLLIAYDQVFQKLRLECVLLNILIAFLAGVRPIIWEVCITNREDGYFFQQRQVLYFLQRHL